MEDDDGVRGDVVEALDALGWDILEAADAENALGLLSARSKVHLLLTEVVRPGMNGRKRAEEAKRRQPSLKVLYMTDEGARRLACMRRCTYGRAAWRRTLEDDV